MTDNWAEARDRSEQKHRELHDRILAIPGSQRLLSKLTKAGADRGQVLSLLSSTVAGRDIWRKAVRGKKRELESIANELETVTKHAQRLSLDPLCDGILWLKILGTAKLENVKPATEYAPIWLFELMRRYAKSRREIAKIFGNILRTYAPIQKRKMISCLLAEVWLRTGKYHDKEIALLLTNAFEAAGDKRVFTEEQIKKHRQRYVMPGIKAYLLSHPVLPTPE